MSEASAGEARQELRQLSRRTDCRRQDHPMYAPALAGGLQELSGDFASYGWTMLARVTHPLQHTARDVHLRHFVLEVFGVAEVTQRHHAHQDGHMRGRVDRVEQALER